MAFLLIVLFGAECVGELLGQGQYTIVLSPISALLGEGSELQQDVQVDLDQLVHAGPKDLDRHLLSLRQGGEMDLAQRGRGDRVGVKCGEHLIKGFSELPLHLGLDKAEIRGGNRVLQPLKFLDKVGRENVTASAGDLAQLDESGPQFLHDHPDALSRGSAQDLGRAEA